MSAATAARPEATVINELMFEELAVSDIGLLHDYDREEAFPGRALVVIAHVSHASIRLTIRI